MDTEAHRRRLSFYTFCLSISKPFSPHVFIIIAIQFSECRFLRGKSPDIHFHIIRKLFKIMMAETGKQPVQGGFFSPEIIWLRRLVFKINRPENKMTLLIYIY